MYRLILVINIIILALLIVGLTATQYYNELRIDQKFKNLTNVLIGGHNALGRIVVDSMNTMSEDKTHQHKELADQILDLQNDIHKILEILNATR